MRKTLRAPVASDDVTIKADFLELSTLAAADRNVSIEDLVRRLRRSGSVEVLGDESRMLRHTDSGSEVSQSLAEATFDELEDRQRACDRQYPFELSDRVISLAPGAEHSAYVFMLLLTKFGIDAGPEGLDGERIFEEICRHAAECYFGGRDLGAEAVHFGFPRRVLPRHFPNALDALCTRVGDMVANRAAPRRHQQKDAKLDIVAWRHFPDRRPGKLLGFGQCAAGLSKWKEKATELQVASFMKRWVREVPPVDPIRMFFVPWRPPIEDHRVICIDGGIVFDRCRIAYLCGGLLRAVRASLERWSAYVVRRAVR